MKPGRLKREGDERKVTGRESASGRPTRRDKRETCGAGLGEGKKKEERRLLLAGSKWNGEGRGGTNTWISASAEGDGLLFRLAGKSSGRRLSAGTEITGAVYGWKMEASKGKARKRFSPKFKTVRDSQGTARRRKGTARSKEKLQDSTATQAVKRRGRRYYLADSGVRISRSCPLTGHQAPEGKTQKKKDLGIPTLGNGGGEKGRAENSFRDVTGGRQLRGGEKRSKGNHDDPSSLAPD